MSRCRRALLRLPEGIVAPAGGYCCACRRVLLCLPEGIVAPAGGHCLHYRRVLLYLPEVNVRTAGGQCSHCRRVTFARSRGFPFEWRLSLLMIEFHGHILPRGESEQAAVGGIRVPGIRARARDGQFRDGGGMFQSDRLADF